MDIIPTIEFKFNEECISKFVNIKKQLYDIKISELESFCRKNNIVCMENKYSTRKKYDQILHDTITNCGITLSLRDIFSFSNELIDMLIYISNYDVDFERQKRCLVASYLDPLIIKSNKKYTISPCFIVNMSSFDDFDLALSIFKFKRFSVMESLNKMLEDSSGKKTTFLLSNFSNNIRQHNIHICLYIIKEYTYISNLLNVEDLILDNLCNIYLSIDSLRIDIFYYYIKTLKLFKEYLEKNTSKIIVNPSSILDEVHFLISSIMSMKEIEINYLFDELDLIALDPLFLSYIDIINTASKLSFDFFKSICKLIKSKLDIDSNLPKVRSLVKILSGEQSSPIFQKFKDYNFIYVLLNYMKYILIDSTFIDFISIFPYDISEIVYLIYLIKGNSNTTGSITVDILNFLYGIKNNTSSYKIVNGNHFYESSHYNIHYVGVDDNYLFCRVARYFLFKDKINKTNLFELIGINCKDSLFQRIKHNRLLMRKDQEYYNQTIDVHSSDRDNSTYTLFEEFLGLNKDGGFICSSWVALDNYKDGSIYEGRLSQPEINLLFKEFWETCEETITDENDKNKFFRVMGYDFDFNKLSKLPDDFGGFLTDNVYIRSVPFNQEKIIAYLWEFAKKNSEENLCKAMIDCFIKMIQTKKTIKDDKIILNEYVVCNTGKLQYLAVSILQGRIRDSEDKILMIDERKEEIPDSESLTPSDMYKILKPFYDAISEEGSIPKNCDELYRQLFFYIKDNNLEKYTQLAIETICFYVETSAGFIIKPELALTSLFDDNFQIDDYLLSKEYVKQNFERGVEYNLDFMDDTTEDEEYEEDIF